MNSFPLEFDFCTKEAEGLRRKNKYLTAHKQNIDIDRSTMTWQSSPV